MRSSVPLNGACVAEGSDVSKTWNVRVAPDAPSPGGWQCTPRPGTSKHVQPAAVSLAGLVPWALAAPVPYTAIANMTTTAAAIITRIGGPPLSREQFVRLRVYA